jgi:amino acid transporter
MIKRLIVLVCMSALACAALLILYHFVFSDILPLAASEETQSVWRFEAAFVVTAATWICGAVCLLSALGLATLLRHRHSKGVNYG